MPERESRKSKVEVDFTKPITNIMSFGGKNDPCFGKFYSPTAKECGRCGDCELCMIAMSQMAKLKRAKIEAEAPFKDREDVDIEIANSIKNQVITNGITSFIQVSQYIYNKFKFNTMLDAKKATKKAALRLKEFKIVKRKKDGKRVFKKLS